MRARIFAATVVAALVATWMTPAQTPEIQKQVERKLAQAKQEKSPLDDLLDLALKNSADVRVAEAKVRLAEAELDKTRTDLRIKVAMLHHEIQSAKAAVDVTRAEYERDLGLYNKGALSAAEKSRSQALMTKAHGDLRRLEAQLDVLTGKAPK
jgi:outer membrane protein TolC